MKTLLDILNLSSEHLKKKGVDEPRLSAELIIAAALGIKRLDIYLQFDRELKEEETARIRTILSRRSKHEPLQYIFGETEFYGFKFKVNPSVLIPRRDTETLVEKAVKIIGDKQLNVLEIGTGSGCISVSVARLCKNAKITATDINIDAIRTAKLNAEINGVAGRIKFLKHDILSENFSEKYDDLISNPPYIPEKVVDTLSRQIKEFEPGCALKGGDDGLLFYRRFNSVITDVLSPGGCIILEIGHDQAELVEGIYKKSLSGIELTRDLNGNFRVFSGFLDH